MKKCTLKLGFVYGETGIAGCRQLLAIHEDAPFPIALIFYHWTTQHLIQINWVYTLPQFRRQGVMTALLASMALAYRDQDLRFFRTASGSAEGGLDWLKSLGFKQDGTVGDYLLQIDADLLSLAAPELAVVEKKGLVSA
jgi:GNAT superfamily N-acetyltransferase